MIFHNLHVILKRQHVCSSPRQGKTKNHPVGSLEMIVENLAMASGADLQGRQRQRRHCGEVKTWEMERSHKLDPNKHRSVDPKVSAAQPGLVGRAWAVRGPCVGLVASTELRPCSRFHISANGGKKFNNDEANQAASPDYQRLSEMVC